MTSKAPSSKGSTAVDCFGECPYFEAVSGTCRHDLRQLLVGYFKVNSDNVCPIYDEWRAEQMIMLEHDLEKR